jgi:fibronectin type 3 domain-containing protein
VPTPAPTAPSEPLNLIALSGTSGAVELTWHEPASDGGDPVIGYNVYRSEASEQEVFWAGGINVTYMDDSAAPGTVLYYKVTAFNAFGESIKSVEVSVTVAS